MPVPTSFSDLDTVAANNSPPGTETAKGNVDNYLRAAFGFIKTLYNSGYPASMVRRLVGNVNSGTPLTKYDLSADIVVLQNSTTGTVTRTATGTLTCDLGLAGSAANGRDQLAAFSASSWIYLYFIWNGTTLATLASTTVPASFTGSTLPSGYTHWAFATALRWNGSSNIVRMMTNGSRAWYDLDNAGTNRVLAGGVAVAMTAINCATAVPPNAVRGEFKFFLSVVNSGIVSISAITRPTGAAQTGIYACSASTQVAGTLSEGISCFNMPLGTSSQIDYKLLVAPTVSGGLNVDVLGFTIPNGDA